MTSETPDAPDALDNMHSKFQRYLVVLEHIQLFRTHVEKLEGVSLDVAFGPGPDHVTLKVVLTNILTDTAPASEPSPPPAPSEPVPSEPVPSEPAPSEPAPAAKAKEPDDLIPASEPYSVEDEENILKWHVEGLSNAEIAARLGRRVQGFHHTVTRIAGGYVPPTPPAEVKPPAAPATGQNPDDMGLEMSSFERKIRRKIRVVGYPAPFSPAVDVDMVEALMRGEKLGHVAQRMQLSPDLLKKRFNALCSDKGLEAQQKLLPVLKKLAQKHARR